MADQLTVVVIGGGVAGMWTAWALADAGANVTLLEASSTGMGASWGNAGWICPAQTGPLAEPGIIAHGIRDLTKANSALSFTPAALLRMIPWTRQFATYCNQGAYDRGVEALSRLGYPSFKLIERLGLDQYCDKTGMLAVAKRRDDVQHFVEKIAPLSALGQAAPEEVLSGDAVQDADPVVPRGYSAVLINQHWQIIPHVFNGALVKAVREAGVTIVEHCRVLGFSVTRGQVQEVQTSHGKFTADHYVVATGAATSSLVRQLGFRLPIVGGKGYSVDVHPRLMPRQAILTLDSHLALSPMANRMRIAGAFDFSQSPTRIPDRRINAMKDSAKQVVGSWDRESAPWAGLRPVAPDGLPLIGRLTPDSNVFVATGYSMLGMTIAPAAGALVADAILLGEDGSEGPFSPQRFDRHRRSPR